MNPCFKCKKRTASCHCECKDYSNWKKEYEKEKAQLRFERLLRTPPNREYVSKYNEKRAYRDKNYKLYSY